MHTLWGAPLAGWLNQGLRNYWFSHHRLLSQTLEGPLSFIPHLHVELTSLALLL